MDQMEALYSGLPPTVTYIGVVSLALAAVLLLLVLLALRRGRPLKAVVRLLLAVAFGAVALAVVAVGAGLRVYQTLSSEETAAVVSVEPSGPQRFVAQFVFPDGHKKTYALAGDELYVDARIIKWKYWANVIGLNTAFQLDRVGGRYRSLDDEKNKPRTVDSLATPAPVDLFELRSRFEFLAPFYDASYGSATFVPATEPAVYEVQVSTTGLLARVVPLASEPVSQ
jgi:hypothetical protein